jgi:hypothetical protein
MKCKLMKHKGTLTIYNEVPGKNNVRLKMQIHKLNLHEEVKNLDLDRELHRN